MQPASIKLLPQVALAHLVSHLHIMTLPALLPVLPAFFNVGYMELGIAISLFNIVSALVQTPLGFAVDRYGARRVLICGMALGSGSFLLVAALPSYAWLLVATLLAGIANGVYHPADYSLLSKGMDSKRMGKAFSIHTFAGFSGAAIAPFLLLGIAALAGVQLAFITSGLIGFAVLAVLLLPDSGLSRLAQNPVTEAAPDATASGRPLSVLTPTIALLTLLFTLLSLSTGALEKFSVAALVQGQDVQLSWANAALVAFLAASALGVLCGGTLADKTNRHGLVAAGAFALAALLTGIVALNLLDQLPLVILLGVIGFLTGIIAPSRDMLVRAAAPAGSEGKAFGIVSTGFNFGGIVGPLLFGWLLDQALGNGIFWAAILFMTLTVLLTLLQEGYLSRHRADKQLSETSAIK